MVAAVRHGASQRAVARQYHVSLSTVQFWLARADDQRLDRVDWSDHPSGHHPLPQRTSRQIENLVLRIRQEVRARQHNHGHRVAENWVYPLSGLIFCG